MFSKSLRIGVVTIDNYPGTFSKYYCLTSKFNKWLLKMEINNGI